MPLASELVTPEVLEDARRRGLCPADLGRELGITRAAVAYYETKYGITLPRSQRNRPRITPRMLLKAREINLYPELLAEHVGTTTASVYRAEARTGIKLNRLGQGPETLPTPEELIADLKPREAVERLLEMVELLRAETSPFVEEALELKLTAFEGRYWAALRKAEGRVCSDDYLLAQVYFDQAEIDPCRSLITVFIHKLRRRLRDADAPWEIKTHWGLGYSLQQIERKQDAA